MICEIRSGLSYYNNIVIVKYTSKMPTEISVDSFFLQQFLLLPCVIVDPMAGPQLLMHGLSMIFEIRL